MIRILKFDSALPPFYLLVTPNNLLHSMMIDIGLIFGLIALSENASLIFFQISYFLYVTGNLQVQLIFHANCEWNT